MIDTYLRTRYQKKMVDPIISLITACKVSPSVLTLFGLLLGVAIVPTLAYSMPLLACVCLTLSGYFDTLDGSLARAQKRTSSKGAVYDIVSDRIVEFSVVLGLFLYDPETRALFCLCMLGSILLCITTFLVVGIFSQNEGSKSFHYSPGLIERSEAFLLFGAMILFPRVFGVLATLFTVLVALTAILRIRQFTRTQ